MLQAQETPSVKVISRTQQDRVLLRWAVDQPQAWKEANTLGFLIERSTISRNGEAVVPIEKSMLVTLPFGPLDSCTLKIGAALSCSNTELSSDRSML